MTKSYVEYYKNQDKKTPVAAYLFMYLELENHVREERGIEAGDLKKKTYYYFTELQSRFGPGSIHGSLGGRLDDIRDGKFKDPLGRFMSTLMVLPAKNGKPIREEWVYYLEPVDDEDEEE